MGIYCNKKEECSYCDKKLDEKKKVCGKCKVIRYCSRECQVAEWPSHRTVCSQMSTNREWNIQEVHNNLHLQYPALLTFQTALVHTCRKVKNGDDMICLCFEGDFLIVTFLNLGEFKEQRDNAVTDYVGYFFESARREFERTKQPFFTETLISPSNEKKESMMAYSLSPMNEEMSNFIIKQCQPFMSDQYEGWKIPIYFLKGNFGDE